jgi:hypothetical protein
VRPSRLAETAKQGGIAGFKIDDLRGNHLLNRLQNPGQTLELGTFANINYQRSTLDLGGLDRKLGKSRDKFDRQVVDAVIAEIFEGFQGGSLSRPTHASDDHKFGARAAVPRAAPVCRSFASRETLT